MNASIFEKSNLFGWCVASHEVGKRSASERAAMLASLGLTGQAWGNRMAGVRDLPLFDAEMAAMKAHGLTLVARYVPTACDDADKRQILDAIARHGAAPQIWATGAAVTEQAGQAQRIDEQVAVFEPWARMAAEYGLQVGLYNHAGWFGDPRNQVQIIQALRGRGLTNVGIAHCQHWGHAWLDDFETVFDIMKPHLLAISLSGMTRDGDKNGRQFLPVGTGDEDLRVLSHIERSGWRGPVGLINHTDDDAALRLREHLAGLDSVRAQLASRAAAAR